MKLYHELARYWPRLSPPEDYAPEAQRLLSRLPRGGRVVEFGAGGGHTLVHLAAAGMAVTAVDLSPAMLERCAALVPGVRCVVGDMRTVRLEETFDAVLIHDAIDYLTVEADVRATLTTAGEHLLPGGLLFVAPTYFRETFEDHATESDRDEGLSWVSHVRRTDEATFELLMALTIVEAGQMRIETDRHACGLFTREQWRSWVGQAGFAMQEAIDDGPYHLLVARRI